MKLLLAEDEMELSNALVAILKHSSYTVDAVYDGQDALDYILSSQYDGIILDIMMPGMEGTEVLKKIREKGINTPVLFLTAKSETDDKIKGLDLGADDYLTKPFEMGELLARIRAMTRRKGDFAPNNLRCGNLELDRASYELKAEGKEPVRLVGREFQMLEMLMENPGRVISVDAFMDRIWADGEADVNVVWVYISNLRKKLAALEATCEIKASRGVGYSMHEIK
ncbi:DNA-binding response regulator, OmpR family, contains REC and winged-helix (wHTH) domain [Butyrivibrio sp. ob235]|uniref:response regulator transcription factor n=1 Tax=Butyrivibrio sp. ob235 TaxID=1761780 RepID=UPI0008C2F23B|nr:response regulator transcription factor [Butyrivibrio sp. ob235]SEM48210.1 DNA-binding response regulator, OmpR family, contains REC and winged-helix (wHTH) domain [Butyrivibrio sp. ob235]